ncbi:MAG: LytR/AlgR family response regulator transcription factor [Flavisolibacter sp.]
MITSLIVDDEIKNIKVLKALLTEFCPQIEIVGEANSARDAIQLIHQKRPALVFLDIEMPYGNGFEMLDELMPVDFEVVFITAYDHYAIKAFKYSALDYLLKPVNIVELQAAVRKAEKQMQSKDTSRKLEIFLNNVKSTRTELQKIAVPGMEGLTFIEIRNIVRCESDGNYTHIYLLQKQKITSSRNIKEFEELLPESIFFRVHNSHLVNLNHIKKYFKGRGGYIVMEDDTMIEVASRRKESFLNRFGHS